MPDIDAPAAAQTTPAPATTIGQPNALYTYLNATLQSPYYRKILEDGARQHLPECKIAS